MIQANEELSRTLIGFNLHEGDFASAMVEMVDRKRRQIAEQKAKARRDRPMSQAEQRDFMRTFVKNQIASEEEDDSNCDNSCSLLCSVVGIIAYVTPEMIDAYLCRVVTYYQDKEADTELRLILWGGSTGFLIDSPEWEMMAVNFGRPTQGRFQVGSYILFFSIHVWRQFGNWSGGMSCSALRYDALVMQELNSVSDHQMHVSYEEWFMFAEHVLENIFSVIAKKVTDSLRSIEVLDEAVSKGHGFEKKVEWGTDLASKHERMYFIGLAPHGICHNYIHYRSPLTDYIGCLTRVGNVRKFGSAGTNQIVVRKMDIDNLNGDVVELALWNEMAKSFNKDEFEAIPKPVIIVVSSCKVLKYGEIGIMNPVASAHKKSYTYSLLEQPWRQSKQTTGSCESSKIHTGTPIPATTSQLIAGTTMTTTPTPLTTPASSPSMDTPAPETPSQHIPETSVPASNNPNINLPETTSPSQPMDKKEPEKSKATSAESTKPLKRTLFPEDPPEHKKNKTD
ncbi:nucleic acid-binding, OB-fold protein [Tanacetum coccineum]